MKKRGSIRTNFIAAVVAATIVLILALAVTMLNFLNTITDAILFETLPPLTQTAAEGVGVSMSILESQILTIGRNPALLSHGSPAAQMQQVLDAAAADLGLTWLGIYMASGFLLTGTSRSPEFMHWEVFMEMREARRPATFNVQARAADELEVVIGSAINRAGEPLYLVAGSDYCVLSSIINSLTVSPDSTAFIVSNYGRYMVHNDIAAVLQRRNMFAAERIAGNAEIFGKILRGMNLREHGIVQFYSDGSQRFLSFAPVAGTHWNLVIETSRDEFIETIYQSVMRNMQFAILLLVALVAIANLFIVRLVSRPLQAITGHVQQLSEGSFKQLLPQKMFRRNNEITQLAEAFNSMSGSLEGVIGDIEAIVRATGSGELDARVNVSALKGDFLKIAEGINDSLDLVCSYLHAIPEAVALFSEKREMLFRNAAMAEFLRELEMEPSDPGLLEKIIGGGADSGEALDPRVAAIFDPGEPFTRPFSANIAMRGPAGTAWPAAWPATEPAPALVRDFGNFDMQIQRVGKEAAGHGPKAMSLCIVMTLNNVTDLANAKLEAETANRSKSNFLASMSHEIRTPMNAITGMAELLLRLELSEEAKGYAQDIKQSGSNLISIINDILDFSKIEAGKLEIVCAQYRLASLINDTVNIILMRLAEKPIRFYTNIDGKIPNSLFGDEVRLRQILLNLLSNAAKYTDRGHISLSITVDGEKNAQMDGQEEKTWLRIVVADTGKGIKPEDMEKLFGEFVQVDMKKNRGIEGTGLGLAITKQLCAAMGGDVGVESKYGKGSVFTALIPQGIASREPFAAVENAQGKKTLVYEGRAAYASSARWSLENMGVPHVVATTQEEFSEALAREEWSFVFAGFGLYEKVKQALEQKAPGGGALPQVVLTTEFGEDAHIPNVRFISQPVLSLSVANVLNGKADSRDYYKNPSAHGSIRYSFPGARLLVVDDIVTNLKVAEGLLAPYLAAVDTCLNGMQAVQKATSGNYDMIFMDHMMPEMDGIEATEAIRAWEKEQGAQRQIPIIALTANAVVGMKEMFLQKGFSDFLAKPIDVSKLDEMLNRWIAREKREKKTGSASAPGAAASAAIAQRTGAEAHEAAAPGASGQGDFAQSLALSVPWVDAHRGIAMTGGTESGYREVLALFRKDAQERLPAMQAAPGAGALHAFVTQVHALKSAAAVVGAAGISAEAAALEAAGKKGDMDAIRAGLPGFAKSLAEMAEGIGAWEAGEKRKAERLARGHGGKGASADGADAAGSENAADAEGAADGAETGSALGAESASGAESSAGAESVRALLRELADVLESGQAASDIFPIISALGKKTLSKKASAALEKISDDVLLSEYGSAGETLARLLEREPLAGRNSESATPP